MANDNIRDIVPSTLDIVSIADSSVVINAYLRDGMAILNTDENAGGIYAVLVDGTVSATPVKLLADGVISVLTGTTPTALKSTKPAVSADEPVEAPAPKAGKKKKTK